MRGVVVLILAALSSCQSDPDRTSAYVAVEDGNRNTSQAERLTKRAAGILTDEPDRAEALLREALVEDLFFGPAHNNLGVVFLNRGDLYAAANEFESADLIGSASANSSSVGQTSWIPTNASDSQPSATPGPATISGML